MDCMLMTRMIDFSDCPFSERHGAYSGQADYKDGIIYNGENWIIKYGKTTKSMENVGELSYTTAPLSEYIGSHIYQILGFATQETLLGVRNGKILADCYEQEIRTTLNGCEYELSEEQILILRNYYCRGGIYDE